MSLYELAKNPFQKFSTETSQKVFHHNVNAITRGSQSFCDICANLSNCEGSMSTWITSSINKGAKISTIFRFQSEKNQPENLNRKWKSESLSFCNYATFYLIWRLRCHDRRQKLSKQPHSAQVSRFYDKFLDQSFLSFTLEFSL